MFLESTKFTSIVRTPAKGQPASSSISTTGTIVKIDTEDISSKKETMEDKNF